MSPLSKCLCIALLPMALASPMQNIRSFLIFGDSSRNLINGRDNSFVWASLGDSWAAGVSYDGDKTDYDGDKNGCQPVNLISRRVAMNLRMSLLISSLDIDIGDESP